MEKYLLENKEKGLSVILGYRDGVLVFLDIKENASVLQVMWVHNEVPWPFKEFDKFVRYTKSKGCVISEIIPDLSFKNFYDTYNYKKGKKSSVERIWKGMDDTEKSKALAYIKKYNYYLSENTGVTKLYPQTYLNRKEWNN